MNQFEINTTTFNNPQSLVAQSIAVNNPNTFIFSSFNPEQKDSKKMSTFEEFIAISRYARWIESAGRRETWQETVNRWWSYMIAKEPMLANRPDIHDAVVNREVFPSMRALMTAGPALDRDHTAIYNCAYLELDCVTSFAETMYILMCGTGVGYSVERRCVEKLPSVPNQIKRDTSVIITVDDSREGWCNALKEMMNCLYAGIHPTWDVSNIRPAGARLKTFGGRASGPVPLENVFKFLIGTFNKAKGRRLSSLECHDIACVIAQSVIVGGVRRSAMISLSDLDDKEMASCKSGNWFENHSYRSLANNSAVYTSKPTLGRFLEEWSSLYNSYSGERGILNRQALDSICSRHGRTVPEGCQLGTNPCSEIILRPMQFCNLSTVVVKPWDTKMTIRRKIEQATILGTFQSKFTYFPYLRKEWAANCNEERLLGVSMTGIWDNNLTSGRHSPHELIKFLQDIRDACKDVNQEWSMKLDIPQSAAITCVKPEGTTSCLAGCASGLHPQYAPYYIRRVRLAKSDPLYTLMRDQGVPCEDCVVNPSSTAVFSFAMAAPFDSMTNKDLDAQTHLILWRIYADYYCEHKPSVTINYTDDEFLSLGSLVYGQFDCISGVSFLPKSDHTYQQAPFEEITQEEYAKFPQVEVDFSLLSIYEQEDTTKASHEPACTAGGCAIV
jgi:ribonucleoside-diphosphate reductase alpha chain